MALVGLCYVGHYLNDPQHNGRRHHVQQCARRFPDQTGIFPSKAQLSECICYVSEDGTDLIPNDPI